MYAEGERAIRRRRIAGLGGWGVLLGVVSWTLGVPDAGLWPRMGLFAAACIGCLLVVYAERPLAYGL